MGSAMELHRAFRSTFACSFSPDARSSVMETGSTLSRSSWFSPLFPPLAPAGSLPAFAGDNVAFSSTLIHSISA